MIKILLAIILAISFGCNTNGVNLPREAKSVDVNIYENSMDGSMTTAEFIAAINNRANVSLMAKLLSIGCALGC